MSKIGTVAKLYKTKFDELNTLHTRMTANYDYSLTDAKDEFEDVLIEAYLLGFTGAAYMLGEDNERPDPQTATEMSDVTYPDGESVSVKFIKYYTTKDTESLKTLAETEFHRMYSVGQTDLAESVGSKGKTVYKKWLTMGDDRVRDAHRYLEGVKVPYDGFFQSADGYKAKAPGQFGVPELDCNCRCIVSLSEE